MSSPTSNQNNEHDKSGELHSPLLATPRNGTATTTSQVQSDPKRFQQDDQIEILDYSEDAAALALYGIELQDNDPSTTLIPKVPSLTQVIRYLHAVPGNMNINDVYGQYIKIAKLSTSDSLNSYPKHVDSEYATLQTSPTTFVDPSSGVSVPIQSAAHHQQLQSTLSTLGQPGIHVPGQSNTPIRTLSSLEGMTTSSSLLQACATGAAAQGTAMRMGSISVTQDGTYLLDQGLGDAIVDNLYSELSTSLGLEFVQYIQTTATMATTNNHNNNSIDTNSTTTTTTSQPTTTTPTTTTTTKLNTNETTILNNDNGNISPTTSTQSASELDDFSLTPVLGQSNNTSNDNSGNNINNNNDSNTNNDGNISNSTPNNNNSQQSQQQQNNNTNPIPDSINELITEDDQIQIVPSQRIKVKSAKLVSKKPNIMKTQPPVNLSKKSLISPSTVYNAHNPEIDNLLQQQYLQQNQQQQSTTTPSSSSSSSSSQSNNNSEADYTQPTFEPSPAPVGASITQTKDHNSMIFINNVDEPLSKTTFEQISFLSGFWPQCARFIVCGILGIVMACLTWFVQWIIGHLVHFLHWSLTTILQLQGGVIGYNNFTYALWPIIAMIVGTIIVVVFWIPGVSLVYWAGIFAVKGSGLPALNAYFDGSYDQNVPLFGTKVLIAKLISVTLSLGGLLKGGLQGPLIHVGAMVARMTLKTTLKVLNTNLAHTCAIYLCCCCFDRRGHARKLVFPWNKSKRTKATSYIVSQHEKDEGINTTTGENTTDYKRQQDSNDYYDDVNNNNDDSWFDVERELREQQIQRYSPSRIGTSPDVEKEMTNRINIYANNVNLQYSTNIISFRENEENRLRTLKKQREQLQQQQRDLLSNTLTTTSSSTTATDTTPSSSSPSPSQDLSTTFQYHNASRIATATQSPSAKGNDYDNVQSLTLSSRLELIVRSLSGPQDEHDALACGATAGFTCAFNAPLAGMVMIQSMIKQQFSFQLTLRMFFTALVSVLVSNLLVSGTTLPDRGFVDLDIPPIHPMPPSELYLCILLGILGGMLGVFIIKFNVFLTKYRVKWYHDKFIPNIQLTILLAMLMIVPGILLTVATPCTPITEESFPLCIDHPIRCMQLSCPNGQFSQLGSLMFGTPDRLLRLAWDRSNDPANEFSPLTLSFFFIIYIVLASASFLGAFPGGFFVPGILIGAMFGRLFARFVNYVFFPYYHLQLGVYATLGSVSMLASVNRVTLPIVAMMVEFTSDVQFLTPIMIIILSAKFVADFFCLGLEPEVGRLQPRITMALGDAANPVMGHVNAKDVLSINSMLQGYPTFCLNDELYPGHSDLAVVGEIDSVHRIQALLETTTHSAFPVVSVLPSHITSCIHVQGLAQRVYQRSILKSLHNNDDKLSPLHGNNNNNLKRNLSSLTSSTSLLSSLSALNFNSSSLGQSNSSGSIIHNNSPHSTTTTLKQQDPFTATLQTLQPYHDDLYAQCPCQTLQLGHGKFVGLITRRSLRTLVEKSVDFSRATRIINSGNHSRLYRGGSSTNVFDTNNTNTNGGQNGQSQSPRSLQLQENNTSINNNNNNNNAVNEQLQQEVQQSQTWYQRLTSKFSKNVNTTDTPGSVDSVTAQIDANKRAEQLDLVNENTATTTMKTSASKSTSSKFGQYTPPQQRHNTITCQCLSCTTHRWALVRYHTPLLALLQHQNTKKRVFPLIANIYFQTGIYLKTIYTQSYQHLIQLAPQFQQQLEKSNIPAHFLSICHPVLVHREILSTTVNFLTSLIKLPKLPQHLQDTIFRLAQMKSERNDDDDDGLDDENSQPGLIAANARRRQLGITLPSTTTTAVTTPTPATTTTTQPIPIAQLVRQTNNDDNFDADILFIPGFIRFVTWLEEKSQIRYSLNKEHITKHQDNTNDFINTLHNRTNTNANNIDGPIQGITASTLCVSMVNTLPLTDTGVYVSSHLTTGARLWRLFRTAGMAKIVIVNDAHEPIGIITRKDIVRADRYLTAQMNGFKTKLKK